MKKLFLFILLSPYTFVYADRLGSLTPNSQVALSTQTSAGAAPGGFNTNIQFSSNSTFGGDNGFQYDSSVSSVTIGGKLTLTGSRGTLRLNINDFGSTNTGLISGYDDFGNFQGYFGFDSANATDGSLSMGKGFVWQSINSFGSSNDNEIIRIENDAPYRTLVRKGPMAILHRQGLQFYNSTGSHYVAFTSSSSIASDYTMVVPQTIPSVGQVMTASVIDGATAYFTFQTPATGGGGGASSLEVFNNFNGARSSPTASIGMSNAFAGSVSGSTFTFDLNSSSVTMQGVLNDIHNQNTLQTGSTFYVSSGTVNQLNVTSNLTATQVGPSAAIVIKNGLNPQFRITEDGTGIVAKLQTVINYSLFGTETNNPLQIVTNNIPQAFFDVDGIRFANPVRMGITTSFASATEQLRIANTAPTNTGLILQGASSQSAHMFEIQDSTGIVFSSASVRGGFYASTFTSTNGGYVFPDGTRQITAAVSGTDGSTIYAATSTASFPFGLSASTGIFTSTVSASQVLIGVSKSTSALAVGGWITTSTNTANPVPTLTSCGTGSTLSLGATDVSGLITFAGIGTSCQVVFGTIKNKAAPCVVASSGSIPNQTLISTINGFIVGSTSALTGDVISYICLGNE